MAGEDFPKHVKEELRKLNDKEEADRIQKEVDKSTCKVNEYYKMSCVVCKPTMWNILNLICKNLILNLGKV